MKRAAIILLLLVAAGAPELLVKIDVTNAKIIGYERVTGSGVSWNHGTWTVQLLDANDELLVETTFEPYAIRGTGEIELLPEAYTSIYAVPRGEKLVLKDNQGVTKDTYRVQGYCGDGYCAPGEEDLCRDDCPLIIPYEQELDRREALPLEPERNAWVPLMIALAALILLLVLMLVLRHMHRGKPPVVEMEFGRD